MVSLVKVRIALADGPVAGETLWAEPAGQNLYRLANCPFYAYGLAEGDLVCCVERDGWPTVAAVQESGGNYTIRIYFAQNAENSNVEEVLRELTSVGCTFERASPQLVAITVPEVMEISFSQLSNYLNATGDDIVAGWEVGKGPPGA